RSLEGVLVAAVYDDQLGALALDGLASRDAGQAGQEDDAAQPAACRLVGDRAAVIACAGRDQNLHAGVLAQRPLGRPAGAEHLERGQAEPPGLVLQTGDGDLRLGRQPGEVVERRRLVGLQRRVEACRIGTRLGHGVIAHGPIREDPPAHAAAPASRCSISSRRGIAGWQPERSTLTAAAAMPNRTASSSGRPSASAAASAPVSASPAPVVSTASAANAGSSGPSGSTRAPRLPSVSTTAGGCSAPSAWSSVSLTTAISNRPISWAGMRPAGAGLTTASAPVARAVSSVAATADGVVSAWVSQTSAWAPAGGPDACV